MHDYTAELMERDHVVAFRQPNLTQDIFFSQFSLTLWIALVMFCLFLVAVMNGAAFCKRKSTPPAEATKPSGFLAVDSVEWIFCNGSTALHEDMLVASLLIIPELQNCC